MGPRETAGLSLDAAARAIQLKPTRGKTGAERLDDLDHGRARLAQAHDRTQPGLPMKKGQAATMTHDYKRHDTTTPFAALDVKSGIVIGACQPKHRAKEFQACLKKIDRAVQKHLDLHLIMDNYATHKTAEVKAWLKKHPRFHVHFIPTSSSWLIRRVIAQRQAHRPEF